MSDKGGEATNVGQTIMSNETTAPPSGEQAAGPLWRLLASKPSPAEFVRGLFSLRDVLTAHLGIDGQQWQSAILPFTRWVKSHDHFNGLDCKKAWREVSRTVNSWAEPPGFDSWWEWAFDTDPASAEIEFQHWWVHMRSLPTADPLEYAYVRSKEQPRTPTKDDQDRRDSYYPAFISFCYHLQHNVGPRTPIYLPLGRLSELFGISEKAISIHRRQAVADGYLVPKAPAVYRPGKPGLAASFLMDLNGWKPIK